MTLPERNEPPCDEGDAPIEAENLREEIKEFAIRNAPLTMAIGAAAAILSRNGPPVSPEHVNEIVRTAIGVAPEGFNTMYFVAQAAHVPTTPGDAMHLMLTTRSNFHMPPGFWGSLNHLFNNFRDHPGNKARELVWRERIDEKYRVGERVSRVWERLHGRKESGERER